MTTATLINTCSACGAEEGLDSLLLRMIDDDQVRRLIADVVTRSLPVGGLVVRYLRLHKPAKQQLRMSRVRAILAELVPDVLRGAITRKGREWQAPMEAWHNALAAVFEAQLKGTLELPLDGNAYLYEVLMRQADRAEGQAEKDRMAEHRHRTSPVATAPVGAPSGAMRPAHEAIAPEGAATEATTPRMPPPGESFTVRKMKAEREAALARRNATSEEPQP